MKKKAGIGADPRRDIIIRAAAPLRGRGYSVEEFFIPLNVINKKRCSAPPLSPLSDEQVRAIAQELAAEPARTLSARAARKPSVAAAVSAPIIEPRLRRGKVFLIDRGRNPACWPEDPIGSPPSLPVGTRVGPEALLPRGTALALNDSGNAERLRLVYGNDLLWCGDFNKWLVFFNGVWVPDNDLAAMMASRVIAMTNWQADQAGLDAVWKFSVKSGDVFRIRGMLTLSQEHLGIEVKELDQRAELLAFLNGTVDLKTGHMRAGRRDDYITKRVPSDYVPDASCPRFLRFLHEVMAGGSDAAEDDRAERMVDALQVFLGYSITGTTIAKTVFIHIGEGGNNGKTTLLTLIRQVLGKDHSTLLKIDSLMQQRGVESSSVTADLADLRGVRFANTSEVGKGKRLDEAKLKLITQGMGEIKGRRLYENPITFDESHKLHIDSNNWPLIHADDDPLWSRLCCIPYERTFGPDEQDKALPETLKAEAEGVLAWLVRGAKRFYEDGQQLPRPAEVVNASAAYRREMDAPARFFDETCKFGAELEVGSSVIYAAYRAWATTNGEYPILSIRGFIQRLLKVPGISKRHTMTGKIVSGVSVEPDRMDL